MSKHEIQIVVNIAIIEAIDENREFTWCFQLFEFNPKTRCQHEKR